MLLSSRASRQQLQAPGKGPRHERSRASRTDPITFGAIDTLLFDMADRRWGGAVLITHTDW
jgi:hypothetical protein